MEPFMPKRVIFVPEALEYPLGRVLYDFFRNRTDAEVKVSERVVGIPGKTPQEKYFEGKRTLSVAVRKDLSFFSCRPSADYSLPLVSGCSGGCQYCYLATQFGDRPYIRIYVNVDEILEKAQELIEAHKPGITTFEASSTSDPLSVEHLTGLLAKAIVFFGQQEYGRLRFVTKFTRVEPLLHLPHNKHTRFRFSVNSNYVIDNFEHNTPSRDERIKAAGKVARAGYPLGFIIAPLMLYRGWKQDYQALLENLSETLVPEARIDLTFELIQFRFTKASKRKLLERFPNTRLDLNEDKRRIKYGRYGIKKWLYSKEQSRSLEEYLSRMIKHHFPQAKIEYFT